MKILITIIISFLSLGILYWSLLLSTEIFISHEMSLPRISEPSKEDALELSHGELADMLINTWLAFNEMTRKGYDSAFKMIYIVYGLALYTVVLSIAFIALLWFRSNKHSQPD